MSVQTYTLITGASSGIGEKFAREYAKLGRNLILVARSRDKLESLRKEILSTTSGISIENICEDLSVAGASEKVFERCKALDVKVSTLINNAGVAGGGLWHGAPLAKVQQLMTLNMTAVTELTWLFMPQLEEFAKANKPSDTTEGGLMNISSTSAFQAIPFMAGYSASKAYVLHLTEAIHDEMRERCPNMRVTCVCPGPTDSTIWDKNGADVSTLRFGLTSVEHVVRDGIKGLQNNKALVIPGWKNYLLSYGPLLGPRSVSRSMASKGMNQSHLAEMELTEEEKKQAGL